MSDSRERCGYSKGVVMRVIPSFIATAAAAVAVVSAAFAGGYSHGNGSGTCSFAPSTALVGQQFTVNATGLPTGWKST